MSWLTDYYRYKALLEDTLNISAASTVQQYFKYTYSDTVYVGATSGTWPSKGLIQFDNANTAIATECAIANLTNEVVDQGIGSYIASQPAGLHMHVRSRETNKFGIYKIEAIPASRTAHKYFAITVINGLALTNGDEVTVTFSSNANCIWDDVNDTITANGVAVAPNVLAVDTLSEAVSLVTVNAGNDRKEFAVLDPGGNSANVRVRPRAWNMLVNNTTGELMQIGGMQEYACNRRVYNVVVPAVNCSARATDSTILTGKLKLTCTAHLLAAGVPAIDTYIPIQTTSGGWTALELVKVLSVSDANSIIVDKDAVDISGNPDIVLINEEFRALSLAAPYPLREASRLKYFFSLAFPISAGTKAVSGRIGAVEYWGGGGVSFTANQKIVTREIHIQAMNATNAQRTTVIANTNSGDGVVNSAGTIPSGTTDTTAAFAFDLYGTLSSSADYFQVTIASAEAGY